MVINIGDAVKFLHDFDDIFEGEILDFDFANNEVSILVDIDIYTVPTYDILEADVGDHISIICVQPPMPSRITSITRDAVTQMPKYHHSNYMYASLEPFQFKVVSAPIQGQLVNLPPDLNIKGLIPTTPTYNSDLYCDISACKRSGHKLVVNSANGIQFHYCRDCKKEAQ